MKKQYVFGTVDLSKVSHISTLDGMSFNYQIEGIIHKVDLRGYLPPLNVFKVTFKTIRELFDFELKERIDHVYTYDITGYWFWKKKIKRITGTSGSDELFDKNSDIVNNEKLQELLLDYYEKSEYDCISVPRLDLFIWGEGRVWEDLIMSKGKQKKEVNGNKLKKSYHLFVKEYKEYHQFE